MPPLYTHAIWAVVAPLGLWCTFLALGTSPYFQRHFLYAHRVSPWWQDADQPQKWGFAKNQVTPFAITTEDGEIIYAWHVIPLPIYSKHEQKLLGQPSGFSKEITSSESFRVLKEDPKAKLILYFHGNAGHLPNAVRAPSFHTLTDTSTYHLLSIDYRGFGKSTGFPTEEGVIKDASALVDFAMHIAGVSPDRIVLLGQSLGTAVTSAIAERYAQKGVDFAGVILVSAFSSLPAMLAGYSIAGWVPVLRPLTVWPWALKWVMGFIADKWESASRLAVMAETIKQRGGYMRLSLVHAKDDWDIPCHEDDKIFAAAVGGLLQSPMEEQRFTEMKDERTIGKGKDAFVAEWIDGNIVIRQELFPYGGHNDIMMYAPVTSEVMKSFGDESIV